MLKTRYRLKGKDVNFLVRKRQYFVYDYFGFFYFEQYPNLKFNQISVNIPLKYSKKAVDRVSLKRQIMSYLSSNDFVFGNIGGKFFKVFVSLNKNKLTELKTNIQGFDKVHINRYIISEFKKSYFKFLQKISQKGKIHL